VPPRNVRSTILISSRRALDATGLLGAYEGHLAEEDRRQLREAIAGIWLPFNLAVAHYAACEALGLSVEDQVKMGRRTGESVNGTLLGTVARLAHTAGVTPWTLIDQLPRFWGRGFDGGELSCTRLGPKEARISVVDQPLVGFSYFRHGLAGLAVAQLTLFCQRAFVRVERLDAREHKAFFRYQWA
jgi:hypothetical protein